MKRVDLYLTAPQVRQLKKLSKKLDLSVSELMRRAVDILLKRMQK